MTKIEIKIPLFLWQRSIQIVFNCLNDRIRDEAHYWGKRTIRAMETNLCG